jgi:hypothetical protein
MSPVTLDVPAGPAELAEDLVDAVIEAQADQAAAFHPGPARVNGRGPGPGTPMGDGTHPRSRLVNLDWFGSDLRDYGTVYEPPR